MKVKRFPPFFYLKQSICRLRCPPSTLVGGSIANASEWREGFAIVFPQQHRAAHTSRGEGRTVWTERNA